MEHSEFTPIEFEGVLCGVSQTVTNFEEEKNNLHLFAKALGDLNSELDAFEGTVVLFLAKQPRVTNIITSLKNIINSVNNQANNVLRSEVNALYSINERLEVILQEIRVQCDDLLIEIGRKNESDINNNDFKSFIKVIESTNWIRNDVYQFVSSDVWKKISEETFFKIDRNKVFKHLTSQSINFSEENIWKSIYEQVDALKIEAIQNKIHDYLALEKGKLIAFNQEAEESLKHVKKSINEILGHIDNIQKIETSKSTNLYGEQFQNQFNLADKKFIGCSILNLWLLFIVIIAALTIGYFIWSIEFAVQKETVNKFIFLRLSVLPVGLLIIWFGISQYNKQKFILEDYAHKKTLALSISVFRESLKSEEPQLKDYYYKNLFEALSSAPLHMYMQKNQKGDAEQMMELAKEIILAQSKESISKKVEEGKENS